ncbi:FHA domain-containing protein [Pseudarthrobacter sp. P1]|uniref:FHA domain-containing protein n=1 Tax=Pseudarthrobacter sp. P1 TaxID=3418418 RepID=UPI003CF60D55
MLSTSYRQGAWLGIVRNGTVLLLPAGTGPDIVERLWDATGSGAGIDAILEAVTAAFGGNPTRMPSFGLVVLAGRLHAIVRGPLSLRLEHDGASTEMTGLDVATWSERSLPVPDVLDLVLAPDADARPDDDVWPDGGGAAADGLDWLPLEGGIVRVGAVRARHLANRADPAAVPAGPAPAGPVEDTSADAAPGAADDPTPEPTPDAADATPAAAAAPTPDPTSDATSGAGPEPEARGGQDGSDPDGGSQNAGPAVVAPDHSGTRPTGRTAILPPRPAIAPSLPKVPAVRGMAPVRVHISTGQVIELDHPLVIGRQPSVAQVVGEVMPRLVQVYSAGGSVSRSHAEIRQDGADVLLVDLRATNGTWLARPGEEPRRLAQGERAIVLDGDIADLGDGISLRFDGVPGP